MTLILIFGLVFVGGPLAFVTLTRSAPSSSGLRRLAMITGLLVLTGLILRYGLAGIWGKNLIVSGVGLMSFWLAWIAVLAFATQMLRRSDPGPRMRRWTRTIGALGTTVPWFGLASANMING